jgi:RNA polymerase sigma-70 factor, ECF subfamily
MQDKRLAEYVAAGRAAWPGLAIEPVDFARYVADRAGAGVLPLANAADVCLAYACVRGVPGAVEAFHATYGPVIARVLARRRAAAHVADDATQTIHERLLVAAPGAQPKIAEYAGAGPLKSWVSTTAATTLAMMHRAASRRREDGEAAGDEGAAALQAAAASPELAHMKVRYKSELEAAIVASLARLDDRARTILRLHLGEQLGIDRIGAMYKVDRSTAARWLAAARASLVASAREEARARLRLSDDECDSIAALVQSELHVSVARLLGAK